MNEIINIEVVQKEFNWEKKRFVNARDLHNRLQVWRRFATRIKERIEKYSFQVWIDYFTVPEIGNGVKTRSDGQIIDSITGRVLPIEYIITIDMAKELAMVENNDVGRVIRKYFIKVESDFRKVLSIAFENPKFINQISQNYLETRVETKSYRRDFTDSIKWFVESDNYAMFTNMVYDFIFWEKAKEYRELLQLSQKDATRDTMYIDVLIIIGGIETGFAEELKTIYEKWWKKLTESEVVKSFKEYSSKKHFEVYKKQARRIMATYDEELRGITHTALVNYKKEFTSEDIQKLLWKQL